MSEVKKSKGAGEKRAPRQGAAGAASNRSAEQESPAERGRREAMEARQAQIRVLRRAANEISSRFGMPGEDEEELENQRSDIRRMISDLDRELEDLRASQSMNFPGPAEIQSLGRAMDGLEARIAAGAAASAIVEASGTVMEAFGL